MTGNTTKPQLKDTKFFYTGYEDRNQGIIRKIKRRNKHPVIDFTIKRLTLHPDRVPANKRCAAWPYCDQEIRDNNWDVACHNHWFGLSREMQRDVKAVLNLPKKSRVRKLVMHMIKERLQAAGKRGELIRQHMREYTVKGEQGDIS